MKKSPEEVLESLVNKVAKVCEGRSFDIKKNLTLEVQGHIYPSAGELEVDGLEVTVSDLSETPIDGDILSALEECVANHINDALFKEDPTGIPQIDDICDNMTSSLDLLEAESIKLEGVLDDAGIEWPAVDWIDPREHTDLWDAIADEAQERAAPSAPLLSLPLKSPPAKPVEKIESKASIPDKLLPRAIAASPVKSSKR